MPRVTVVIATYNWSAVLPYSIGSVLDQTFSDFELMVVGDGCTDDSGDVVAAVEDPRVSWLNLAENTGHQSGPNNEAIRRSDSELIAYLGHDDLWLPRHLEVLVDALAGAVDVGHGSVLLVREGSSVAEAFPSGEWSYHAGEWIPPTSLVHARSLAEEVGGWMPPWRTGGSDPEAHLLARMLSVTGRRPTWVPTVTSVKLPAAWRAEVYRTRPCHEQAAWLGRIRSGETWDHLLAPPPDTPAERARRAAYLTRRALGRQSWRRRLRGDPPPTDDPLAITLSDAPGRALRRWQQLREFKGLDTPE